MEQMLRQRVQCSTTAAAIHNPCTLRIAFFLISLPHLGTRVLAQPASRQRRRHLPRFVQRAQRIAGDLAPLAERLLDLRGAEEGAR